MNIDLSGKTALITGSTEGIGFGIAQGLARAGHAIVRLVMTDVPEGRT